MPLLKNLRKYIFWLILCVGLAVLLKWGVVAGYTIPTPSMEPMLRGHPEDGDKVAVFKLYYKLFSPSRYDLVVFFKEGSFPFKPGILEPSGGINFVKRLAAFPGESLRIKNGDLYIDQSMEPDRKSIEVINDMLIPVYHARFDDHFLREWVCTTSGGSDCLTFRENGLVCNTLSAAGPKEVRLDFSSDRKVIYDDYLMGDRKKKGRNPVRDLALTMEIESLAEGGEISGELKEMEDRFRFVLRSRKAGGGGEVTSNRIGAGMKSISREAFPGFAPGETVRISFMNIDDRILLQVDGDVLLEFPYKKNTEVANPNPTLWNTPALQVRDAKILFKKIQIDRDVHYTNPPGKDGYYDPIPDGKYFFLGDNSPDSQDSRVFGPVSEEDFVGKPFMIFYPFSRIRFF
jgi:signal peptidase I